MICTSFKLTADTAAYLEILIEEHHQDFMKLYPTKSIIPKMHFMVHFPRQILNFGPLVHAWTMRHEAKLRVIKRAAKVSNFKNVCKTVAKRHQHLLCFYIHSNLLVRNIVNTATCKPFSMHNEPEMLQLHLNEIFGASNVMVVSFVTSNGFMYKQNAIILHKYDALCPTFCKIYLLLKNESEKIFLVLHEYETLFFDSHFNCYCIKPTSSSYYIYNLEIIPFITVYHVRRSFAKDNRLYVGLKCTVCL